MIVLDEQLLGRNIEEQIARWYQGAICFIADLRPNTVIKDDAIPKLLQQEINPPSSSSGNMVCCVILFIKERVMNKSLKPQPVDFNDLTRMLKKYERKFGYSTIEFFRRYSDGKLGDNDEFMMWAGIYHLYLTSLPVRKFMREDAALAG